MMLLIDHTSEDEQHQLARSSLRTPINDGYQQKFDLWKGEDQFHFCDWQVHVNR